MHDPLAMRPVQCTGNLLCNSNRLFEGKWTPGEACGERLAVEQLHYEEVEAVLATEIVKRTDVRVIEGCNRARFPLEPCACVGIRELRWQHLDGDGPFQPRVPRPIHLAHAAGAE